MTMPYKTLQIRRGLKADIPIGVDGELLFAEDTNELFVGTPSSGNFKPNQGYEPTSSGDWNGDPTNFSDAIDRIAAAVATLLGGPIP